MKELLQLLISDPIFQLSAVIFISSVGIGIWMFLTSQKREKSTELEEVRSQKQKSTETVEISEEMKYHIIIENIIAINRKLDSIEAAIKSLKPSEFQSDVDSGTLSEISKKLDAIYKILGNLNTR